MRGRLRWFLEGAAHHITMLIGLRYGDCFPMHFVCGYPRSGTTWFSELLADYLNLPRPRHYIFPIGFAAVVHTHFGPTSKLDDCFYVMRDGRDALVSAYFKLVKTLREGGEFVYRDRYLKLFAYNLDDTKRNLETYVRFTFENEKAHWGNHVTGWIQKAQQRACGDIVIVRYEDLLQRPCSVFSEALQTKYGDADLDFVKSAVDRQRFDRQRRRSSEQHRTFLRKGQAGDWRNWFTRHCAQVFDRYAGDALIEAGYERDHSWAATEYDDTGD